MCNPYERDRTAASAIDCARIDLVAVQEERLPKVESVTDTGNPHLNKVLSELRRHRLQLERDDNCLEEDYAEAWNSLGLIRIHMQNNADEARKCHEQALRIFRAKDTTVVNIATTLIDLGLCYERLAKQEQALKTYEEALQLLKSHQVSDTNILVRATQRSISRLCRS